MEHYERAFKLALPLITRFEGFRGKAYWDVRRYAIGYGTTSYPDGKDVREIDTCTIDQAVEFMKHDLFNKRFPFIEKKANRKLLDSELAALAAFAYNLGNAGFSKSRVLAALNDGGTPLEVASAFQTHNTVKGKVLGGLTKRRLDEAKLYLSDQVLAQS